MKAALFEQTQLSSLFTSAVDRSLNAGKKQIQTHINTLLCYDGP